MSAAYPCRLCSTSTTRRHVTGAPLCEPCAIPPANGIVRAGLPGRRSIEGTSLDDIARKVGGPKARWYYQTASGADPVQIYVVDRRYVDDERPVTTLTWVAGLGT